MADIYGGAYCTITVVFAWNGHESLFTKSNPVNNELYTTSLFVGVYLVFGKKFEEAGEPLYERAWVFQERLLFPRLFQFTNNGIAWRCGNDVQHSPKFSSPAEFYNSQPSWERLVKHEANQLVDKSATRIGSCNVCFTEKDPADVLSWVVYRCNVSLSVLDVESRTLLYA